MKIGNLIFIGMIAGLIIGLIFTWLIIPIEYYDTWPPMMDQQHQQDWVAMTAIGYGVEGNWERTLTRLSGIDKPLIQQVLASLIEDSMNAAYPMDVLKRMAELGDYYAVDSPAVKVLLSQDTEIAPTYEPVPTATMTVTPLPTHTPIPPTYTPWPTYTPTPSPTPLVITETFVPFTIISQTLGCADVPSIGISLQLSQTVTLRREAVIEQVPQPGREIWLIWEAGADRAVTGFKPDYGLGYADFDIEPGWTYNIYIDQPTGAPLLSIQAEPCILPGEPASSWTTRVLTIQETLPEAEPTPGD